jgi:hypothetical protein
MAFSPPRHPEHKKIAPGWPTFPFNPRPKCGLSVILMFFPGSIARLENFDVPAGKILDIPHEQGSPALGPPCSTRQIQVWESYNRRKKDPEAKSSPEGKSYPARDWQPGTSRFVGSDRHGGN